MTEMEVPIEYDQPWPPFNMPWGTDDSWDFWDEPVKYIPHCPEGEPCPYEEESTKGGEG